MGEMEVASAFLLQGEVGGRVILKGEGITTISWGQRVRGHTLVALLTMLMMSSPSPLAGDEIYPMARNTGSLIEAGRFVYVSEIGGMVGGFTATSNSRYIGGTGLVQVSREETNGVIHMLRMGHADTEGFLRELAEGCKLRPPERNSAQQGEPLEVSEYYPPETLVCYLTPSHHYVIYSFKGKEVTDVVRGFVNQAAEFVARSELSSVKPGLYVRAQRILESDAKIVKPDVVLERSELAANKKLLSILENEMALVRVGQETDRGVLRGKITFLPDKPIHIQIEDYLYLVTTYRYNG